MKKDPKSGASAQFRRRILLVEPDPDAIQLYSKTLEEQNYDVRSVGDGFSALQHLRGALPEAVVTELNLPHLSGFELLSILRSRFPQVGVIAMSAEYNVVSLPDGLVADAFLHKEVNSPFELTELLRELMQELPIRGSRPKSGLAPVWVPRSHNGYLILTCPDCLRSFSVAFRSGEEGSTSQEICIYCDSTVRFRLGAYEVGQTRRESPVVRSQQLIQNSRDTIDESQNLLEQRKKQS